MTHTITLSKKVHDALQRRALFTHSSPDSLVERWVKQRLELDVYSELTWRHGPSGWRVGVKGTAVDVYTIVAYSQIGYTPHEIAVELLPALSLEQVRTALQYYADYPNEIDYILSQNEPEMSKARLYRSLGPKAYRQVTGSSTLPRIIADTRAPYQND